MIDPARRRELIEASIKNHSSGRWERKWSTIAAEFPDIPRATAYRIIAKVYCANRRGENLTVNMFDERPINPTREPFVPSPTPGLLGPDDPLPIPDQLTKLRELYDDATKLMKRSLDKNGKIKNAGIFQKSIELRLKIATADANMAIAVMDAGRIETVLNGIGKIARKYDTPNGFYLVKEVHDYYDSMLCNNQRRADQRPAQGTSASGARTG